MTLQNRAPEPKGDDWKTWARRMMQYLGQVRVPLVQQTGDESAAEDGQLMWDRSGPYPVVSLDGEWRQLIIAGGNYFGKITSDVTAASTNTAYALTYTADTKERIENGTPASRLVFDETGEYLICTSFQFASSSIITVNFYFWLRKNGTDIADTTMTNALHQNNAVLVTSRDSVVHVDAGDYIEVMWAVDSTNGRLDANAATAFAPSAPAATIAISRFHA